ncbi:hypothetical protein HG530_007462 [Fusarium avenaceum]|nr:hypothetical protein HG530_007462 [Fusarium avenaceum]
MSRFVQNALGNYIRPLLLRAMLAEELVVPGPCVSQITVQHESPVLEPVLCLLQPSISPEDASHRNEQNWVALNLLDGLETAGFALCPGLQMPDLLCPDKSGLLLKLGIQKPQGYRLGYRLDTSSKGFSGLASLAQVLVNLTFEHPKLRGCREQLKSLKDEVKRGLNIAQHSFKNNTLHPYTICGCLLAGNLQKLPCLLPVAVL